SSLSRPEVRSLKLIAVHVGVDDGLFALLAGLGVAMLHPHNPVKALSVDMLEDVAVVDLARCRLLAAGIVSHLEVGDFAPSQIDVGNQIPFGDLLVINVEENFAGWAVDGPADHVRLRD